MSSDLATAVAISGQVNGLYVASFIFAGGMIAAVVLVVATVMVSSLRKKKR